MTCKKVKKDSPTGWVDDLKAKLKKWATTEAPNPFAQNETPTYMSERKKRIEEKDPLGSAGAVMEPTKKEEEVKTKHTFPM